MEGSCKVIYKKGLPNIRGNAQMFYYMRRPLVIYDFAIAPLKISLYMRKIRFSFFYECTFPNIIFRKFNRVFAIDYNQFMMIRIRAGLNCIG